MLCSAVTLALGVLTGWHCNLISRGETSIECHINKGEAKNLKKQGLVSATAYNFQRTFLSGLYSEGLTYQGLIIGGKFAFRNQLMGLYSNWREIAVGNSSTCK